ncbi:MAG TPA: chemotaxis protein CheA [Gemmatimonadaceae bacterium]|nr:chemotaxis protein CheA [Gemmatimonadaceae bacterium]
MDLEQYAELFFAESQEHLAAINQALLELETRGDAPEAVDSLFRSVHTLKGMSAAMGYACVAELAHEMETLLDVLRGAGIVPADAVQGLFSATDQLEATVARAVAGEDGAIDVSATVAALRQLARGSAGTPDVSLTPVRLDAVPAAVRLVRVRQEPHTPLPGVRALLVLRQAERLGRVSDEEPARDALPLEQYGDRFQFRLHTTASPSAIAAAVRSAGDVAEVMVDGERVGAEAAAPAAAIAAAQPAARAASQPTSAPAARTIRIDPARLDAMLDLTGELVIARGRLVELAAATRDPALQEAVAEVTRHVRAMQEEILAARLVPVWQLFERFPRLVRDAARQVHKEVRFEIEGREIELDRSLLDEIVDPVVHLLRNAVDHGIELPDDRRAAGKDPTGQLVLAALRDRDTVLIRVIDDGKGIDRARVLRRALEQGLVDAGTEALTDEQLLRCISQAGFSTAEQVTGLSGRGVGVDAVQSRLRALGGTMEVDTADGRGTMVTLRLPMTLAIVRAVIARVGGEVYALPAGHVAASGELAAVALTTVRGEPVMVIGDDVLPAVDFRTLVGRPAGDAGQGEFVVLEGGDRRIGLMVDELTGEQEIVVKRFDGARGALPIFSGATILGNGMPALIVDVGRLF